MFLFDTLAELGIDCRALVFDQSHNITLAFVSISKSGDRNFTFYRRHGADCFLDEKKIYAEVIENGRIFHFGTLSMTQESVLSTTIGALQLAKENHVLIYFDPNYRALLWWDEKDAIAAMKLGLSYADIGKLSHEEAQMLTGQKTVCDCLNSLLHIGVSFAAVSLGKMGVPMRLKIIQDHARYRSRKLSIRRGREMFYGGHSSTV